MATITNSTGLPEPIYRALAEPHAIGAADYSITDLLRPARKALLERELGHLVTEDVKDMADRAIGNAVHEYFSRRAGADELSERRLTMEMGGTIISGALDLFHLSSGTLTDFKTPKTSSIKYEQSEWEAQTNCYAELLRVNGYDVAQIQIVTIYKDYSFMRSGFKGTYPDSSIQAHRIEMWEPERTQEFLWGRILAHRGANRDTLCSDEERWARPTYAVTKPGADRAWRVFDSEEEATANIRDGYEVQFRPGEPVRCIAYCAVSQWCEQYQGES